MTFGEAPTTAWSDHRKHLRVWAYGLVALSVAGVTLLRLPLEHVLHGRAPFALYYLPILWAAWYGGVGPTLAAIALSFALSWAFIVPVLEPGYRAALALFLVVSGSMVVMARVARTHQEAKFYLASIVESSDDAIVTKNLDGIIQSWNAGAERLFGYTADEVVGRPVTILIPPEHQDEERGIPRTTPPGPTYRALRDDPSDQGRPPHRGVPHHLPRP